MSNDTKYSSFWPMVILMGGLIAWCGYQLFEINKQRMAYNAQYDAMAQYIAPSQKAEAELRSIVEDLIQTSNKDQYAAQILKESIQAGIIHVNNNKADTSAAPAK